MLKVHNNIQAVPSKQCVHGHCVIGATRSILGQSTINLRYGIIFYADEDNTAAIWVGNSSVTANSNATTGGFPLSAGSSIMLPFSDFQNLYGVSTDAGQNLAWIGM